MAASKRTLCLAARSERARRYKLRFFCSLGDNWLGSHLRPAGPLNALMKAHHLPLPGLAGIEPGMLM